MIINSGVTNISDVVPFEVGNAYKLNDIVYFSGYTDPADDSLYPCTQAQSGHYYYSGKEGVTSTISNTPAALTEENNPTDWTQKFFFEPSYGATVAYKTFNYSTKMGDGYYSLLNRSENALRAEFNLSFNKRTDSETRAIVHLLEDSFNKGTKPSGGYSGINWAPFNPYNLSGEFFVENISHSTAAPEINNVSTTFFNETVSLTDWQQLHIPYAGTRQKYEDDEQYYQHDAAFFLRKNTAAQELLPRQSGWYYFTGEKNVDYTSSDGIVTGLKGTVFNSPSGDATLWTKDTFYFDANDQISLEMSPTYYSQDLQNQFKVRFGKELNKNLLKFSLNFRGRTDTETKAMVHFLEHHQGSALFNFTPPAPYNKRKVFISSNWQHTLKFKDNNNINVEFLEFPIDYLNITREFRTLVTIVNRPVTTIPQHADWGGSTTVKARAQNTEFTENTGIPIYVPTGFTLRTGFYLTNSGNVTIKTTLDTSQNEYSVFEFPSGSVDNPIITPPGVTHFVPFYFNGFGMNTDQGSSSIAADSPQITGYNGYVTLSTVAEVDNEVDPSGTIELGITGYISGWDFSPYAGRLSETPMFPSKFLVKTGYYDVSGRPFHYLQWEHPTSGYYLTRYNLEASQGPADGFTGLTDFYTDSDDPGRIGFKTVSSYDGSTAGNAGNINTLLYTGIAFPPSLAQDAIGSPFTDPIITGYHQSRSVLHTELQADSNYYYRIRSEYQNAAGEEVATTTGSMYIYASGVDDLNQVVSDKVYTGLGLNSFALPITDASNLPKIQIPVGNKPAMRIFLPHGSTNLNLSGIFIQELVKRGIVTQTDGLDNVPGVPYETSPEAWLNAANTGVYADNFTGIQYILRPNFVVGSTDSINPSIDTGYQLLTGAVNPTDAGAGADPNLQKPIKETPTVLVMQYNSVVAGKGGAGGDGGYTLVKNIPAIQTKILTFEFEKTENSTVGLGGGDAIKISDTAIGEFKIRKDYTAKVLGAGGGGGGGDRFLVEKIFALHNSTSYNIIKFTGGSDVRGSGEGLTIDFGGVTVQFIMNTGVIVDDEGVTRSVQGRQPTEEEWLLSSLGTHYGGPGGGGQGYVVSEGGRQLSPDAESKPLNIELRGGFYGSGPGYTSTSIKQTTRHSKGGAGGGYGERGVKGQNMNDLGAIDPFTVQDDTVGQLGGDAGKAIRVIAGNTNYTKSNFRSVLLEIAPSRKFPSDIPGLVANFDSAQNVYSAYTNESTNTAATNGQSIVRWASTNNSGDDGIYMEQTTNANNNRPTYRTADYTNFKGTTLYKRYFNDAPFIYFDPAYYGYHTSTPTRPGAQYFKLINATVDQSYTGAIQINSSGKTYQPGLYPASGSGIAVASLPSKILANDTVYFAGGGEFQLAADAASAATALFGTLKKRQVNDSEYGSNRLSSFMNGFDIFYVIYPDKWDAQRNYIGGWPALPRIFNGTLGCWRDNQELAGGTNNKNCTYTSGNTTITAANVTDIKVGEMVIGDDIPVNAKVSSISDPDVVLSVAPTATATGAGKVLTFVRNEVYDDLFQVGWMRWSAPFVKPKGDGTGFLSAYYHRCGPSVKENTGVSRENANNYLIFKDLNMSAGGPEEGANLIRSPRSAWIYNLSAQRKNGLISLLARCNGVPVGKQQFKTNEEAFDFLSSGNVLIGASALIGEYRAPFGVGYKGALAHMVVYNRLLTSGENRNILGFLYNKYLTVKGADAGDPLSVDTVNAFSDNNGFAGQILFE